MSVSKQNSVRSSWRSNLGLYTILALGSLCLLWIHLPHSWVSDDALTVLTYAFFLSWVGMPVAVYADIRTVRARDGDWAPKAPYWVFGSLLPLVNVSVVIPYVLRRYEQVNCRVSWDFWWRIAGTCVSAFLVLIAIDVLLIDVLALESAWIDGILTESFIFLLISTPVLIPMAMKYDIAFVERHFGWEPDTWLWVVGSAIPLLNVLVVLSYAVKRTPESPHSMVDETATDASGVETTVSSDERPSEGEPWGAAARRESERDRNRQPTDETAPVTAATVDSNWWCWPAGTVALTGVTIVLGLGTAVASVTAFSWLVWPSLVLLALLVVLLAFVGYGSILAIHFDARAIRETDANWQPSVIGYALAGVLLSPLLPALVYVIQRYRHLGRP